MRDILTLTKLEVAVLFDLAGLEYFKVSRLEKTKDDIFGNSITVYAKSRWDNGDGTTSTTEDEIVQLYQNRYYNRCDFSPGFNPDKFLFTNWLIWCQLIEPIVYDFEAIKAKLSKNKKK